MLADSNLVPCVVFAFNRPDKLQCVLSALKTQDIERLIVFVDGPRHEGDIDRVEDCKAIAQAVNWVDKELHLAKHNRGLPALSDNVSTVLNMYRSAVFVEDDCLPMPGFYSFMRLALVHYETAEKVFSIGGYQPLQQKCFKNYPYSLVSFWRFHPWGWATWRDRWQLVNPYLVKYSALFDGLSNVPDVTGDDLASLARACAQGRIRTWDIQVAIATLSLEKVHLFPTRGLIRSIGNDGSGVHGHTDRYRMHNKNVCDEAASENIVWLEDVEPNGYCVKELKQYYSRAGQRSISFPRKLRNRLRQWPLMARIWPLLRRAKAKLLKPHQKRLYDLVLQQNGLQPLDKRALLSYIVHPFSIPRDDPRFLRHINIWRVQEVVRILNGLGYIVDVVDYRDTSFAPRRSYDLFIGHGGINFVKIARRLSGSAASIYFSTGCYWRFWNQQELARLAALRERRGVDLAPDRLIWHSEESALLAADGVIGIGNDFTRKTYADFSPVIMINNTALFDDYYESHVKDFQKGREHFLYFSGPGPVHKGLDLLLESFVGLDQHLWICSRLEQSFVEVYSDELHNHSNIHLVGWVQLRSAKFYELMNTCNYVIAPSCAEGQPHSLVECMNQGLIPVVSRACGLDVDGYGVLLDPCTIQKIARVVSVLSCYPAARCHEMSARARNAALTDFSETAFRRNMTTAIRQMASPGAFVRCEEMNSAHGPEN